MAQTIQGNIYNVLSEKRYSPIVCLILDKICIGRKLNHLVGFFVQNIFLLNSGVKPLSLLADPQYVKAWPGGSGYAKMGSNFAPTLFAQQKAESLGCQQYLWLFGPNEEITEVGSMNIFVLLRKE